MVVEKFCYEERIPRFPDSLRAVYPYVIMSVMALFFCGELLFLPMLAVSLFLLVFFNFIYYNRIGVLPLLFKMCLLAGNGSEELYAIDAAYIKGFLRKGRLQWDDNTQWQTAELFLNYKSKVSWDSILSVKTPACWRLCWRC